MGSIGQGCACPRSLRDSTRCISTQVASLQWPSLARHHRRPQHPQHPQHQQRQQHLRVRCGASCSPPAMACPRQPHLRALGGGCFAAGQRRGMRAVCAAYGRGGSSDDDLYSLLGLDPECDEDDIKSAFRRRAKELHPDVNKEEGAEEAFVQLKRAYETLSDPDERRRYDATRRPRRVNFFRDVDDEDEPAGGRRSPFRWSHVGHRGGGMRPGDSDSDEEEYGRGRRGSDGEQGADDEDDGGLGCRRGEDDDDGEEEDRDPAWRSQEEVLEQLSRFMSGGSLRAFQSGRLDPWGTSTSDSWFRQVERQTRSPYGPARPGYGSGSSGDDGDDAFGSGRDWDPSRRPPGWTPPGRDSEWNHPRRQWDEEDRRGPGPGRQGGGGGGDFRRPFKI